MKTIKWKFKEKECIMCCKKFKPINGKQITCCDECSEKLHLINSSKYNSKYPERVSKSVREHYQRNKKGKCEYQNKYNKEHKEIINVRSKTSYWIRKLNLRKGFCNDCGKETELQSHHFSYNPNIFILVCENCQYKRHNKENRK